MIRIPGSSPQGPQFIKECAFYGRLFGTMPVFLFMLLDVTFIASLVWFIENTVPPAKMQCYHLKKKVLLLGHKTNKSKTVLGWSYSSVVERLLAMQKV